MELEVETRVVIEREQIQRLLDVLRAQGYQVVGPTLREGAVVYDEIVSVDDLPVGWTDEQDGGTYRLKRRGDEALFGYAVGPQSWKKFLYPPAQRLWQAERRQDGLQIKGDLSDNPAPGRALIGVRACELRAIATQDRVFMQGTYADPGYQARRANTFIVAVNCSQAGGTCFCVSMQSGPQATTGFDLALTEILNGRHYFVAQTGTERGAQVLEEIPHRTATAEEIANAERIVRETAAQMGRTLDTSNIMELLYRNYEHPRWDDVAARCLSCTNCTLVCPTCFCTTVEDVTVLSGAYTERWRRWDSCYTMDFSYIHGGSVRASPKSRYRQWMTHKLATWIDQFGTSGCVGCGRCITWCPVGIDITEEARAIRASEAAEPVVGLSTTGTGETSHANT